MPKPTRTKDEIAADACGMTIEQFRALKTQTTAAKQRGKRPAGTAGAETKLTSWGEVDGQEQLFANEADGAAS